MIIGAMLAGGSLGPFVDTASILIVIGGTFFAVMYQATLPTFLGHFGAMGKTFFPPVKKMEDMIERMVELAAMARKDGMMALEGQETPDKFFAKGMQLLVDGADEAKLVGQMEAEIEAMKVRHGDMQGCVKAWIDLAPAMGMIGTLVGLVIMLGNMSDPASIGPAMAVAPEPTGGPAEDEPTVAVATHRAHAKPPPVAPEMMRDRRISSRLHPSEEDGANQNDSSEKRDEPRPPPQTAAAA